MKLSWRRGHIDANASKLHTDAEARSVAKTIPAFIDEPSEIEMTMKSLGVEVVSAPKGHCEITGRGIECVWGASKIIVRKENAALRNDSRVNNLPSRARKLLESTSLEVMHKC